MKYALIFALLLSSAAYALTAGDLEFLLDTEQFSVIEKHHDELLPMLDGSVGELNLVLAYAERADLPVLKMKCHERLAFVERSLEHALQWIASAGDCGVDSLAVHEMIDRVYGEFSSPEDLIVLDYHLKSTPVEDYLAQIGSLRGYNSLIEDLAKSLIDDIAVERSDSLALSLIDEFEDSFQHSEWMPTAYYYKLFHLSQSSRWTEVRNLISASSSRSAIYGYISALYLLGPGLRKQEGPQGNIELLKEAKALLERALNETDQPERIKVLFSDYSKSEWHNRLRLTEAKADYYLILAEHGYYGDEESVAAILPKHTTDFKKLLKQLAKVRFEDNDEGDLAELNFWLGKVQALSQKTGYLRKAAKSFTQSLVYGAPRKKFDPACQSYLEALKDKLGIELSEADWSRQLMRYKGIVFEEMPGFGQRYTRIAIGDYNNDGYLDLLFNGNALYRNDAGKGFTDVSEAANVAGLQSSGGLWADFNRDGLLDFVAISHNADGLGESLMKNQDGERFVKVNERAGDIDDRFPTEGAAWVDAENAGYPSLYCASYEKWQVRPGYPDFFWHNERGYFSDESVARGFRSPAYADNPGLAGRGVAPADFDNDGHQEILVTNYRLNRNLCWKQADSLFVDVAPLYGLTGHYKQGYFGHSIGADWGDFDNDGDLDLFIANLAHPRYIEISDTSQLLRNDGLAQRVVGADTLYYWKFTDVTRKAGITYDELHSDPLWLDADNDGYLDLFITSVYENDRSYLYKNNGDGTFTDITWLANARIYNGWGNATGDLDRDGLTDLVVGSGNGAKVLLNRTQTRNKSVFFKPVWAKDEAIYLPYDFRQHSGLPNSPAFGQRMKVTVKGPWGKTRTLIRELSSAKGTTSQSSQELHFGLGTGKLADFE